jgi:hypothetical protein
MRRCIIGYVCVIEQSVCSYCIPQLFHTYRGTHSDVTIKGIQENFSDDETVYKAGQVTLSCLLILRLMLCSDLILGAKMHLG